MPRIKEVRKLIYEKYNSEAEMASRIGWSKQRLNRITNGAKRPSLRDISELSIGLEIDATELARIFLLQ